VTTVTANSISLRWNAAPTDLDDPVISFIIQYRATALNGRDDVTGGFREIRDVTRMEYDVSGLEAFTRYELRVVAVNSVGRSQPSHSVDATTSQLGMIQQ